MRRVIFQMMVTLDGYFEGPDRDISWHNVDAEFNEYAIDLLKTVDTLLFGRVTYELQAIGRPLMRSRTIRSSQKPIYQYGQDDRRRLRGRTRKSEGYVTIAFLP